MKNYGPASVAEFLDDFVVYRNLVPMDVRLPSLDALRGTLDLPEGVTPRKSDPDYGRVMVHLLQQARALSAPGTEIARLVYVGDTRLNDGTAFVNACRAGGWPGIAFIGAEKGGAPQVEVAEQDGQTLYLANRWSLLADFDAYCHAHGFPPDERTAVILDLDKTTLGARGRNDHVINAARVAAVRRTVGDLLGDAFDADSFQEAYNLLNRTEFHPFTTDNQDYLAYICLIVGSGLFALAPLADDIRAGRWANFVAFIDAVNDRAADLPADLCAIHWDIYAFVQQGDPTPFKAFRFNEYRETVGRMGRLPDDASPADLLAREICITREVRDVALAWREQGALLFGLSDKPDEASIPTDVLAAQGYVPIHRARTHVVGD